VNQSPPPWWTAEPISYLILAVFVITFYTVVPSAFIALGITYLTKQRGTYWQQIISMVAIGLVVANHTSSTMLIQTANLPRFLPITPLIGWVAIIALIIGITLNLTNHTRENLYLWSQIWSILAALYAISLLITWLTAAIGIYK
jgi:hypothetical protein